MLIEASALLASLQSFMAWIQRNRQHQDAQIDAALAAITKALIESKKYSKEQRESLTPDLDRESKLSELWADAAIKARHASIDLSERLQDKSLYWSEDMKWSREEVLQKRIDFDAVQKEITLLLRS